MINFAYTQQTEREVRELLARAPASRKRSRACSTPSRSASATASPSPSKTPRSRFSEADAAPIPLRFLEDGLAALATRAGFDAAIAAKDPGADRHGARPASPMRASTGADIHTVFFTGGRSPRAGRAAGHRPGRARSAQATTGSDLLSVALGLTREAARRLRLTPRRHLAGRRSGMECSLTEYRSSREKRP